MAPATTTTKKPATARRTAAQKPAAAPAEPEHTDPPPPAEDTEPQPPPELDLDGGDGDVIVIPAGKATKEPEEPKPVPVIKVFTYGEKTYTMPVEVTAQQAMHATWVMKTHGTLTGGLQIVERLLGPEALQVLLTAPEIEDEHLFAVITKVTKHVWGRSEEAQGE
ncbi:hypothetical protein ACRYCC_26300 [Actinomadura scrupuli]|uniref:hypothetical protein n=1 Tax=Actinomadura scrupuli TaxID=559629 RepID=UPI003D9730A5